MTLLVRATPLLLALAAAPAFAQSADPHAGHHPAGAAVAAPAKPDAKLGDAQGCAMMKGRVMGGQPMGGQMKGADGKTVPGQMAMGSGDHMQHCMMMSQGKSATPPPNLGAQHDHQHQ